MTLTGYDVMVYANVKDVKVLTTIWSRNLNITELIKKKNFHFSLYKRNSMNLYLVVNFNL